MSSMDGINNGISVGDYVSKAFAFASAVYLYCKLTAKHPPSNEVIGASDTYELIDAAELLNEDSPASRRNLLRLRCQGTLRDFERAVLTSDTASSEYLGYRLEEYCGIDPQDVVSKLRMKREDVVSKILRK